MELHFYSVFRVPTIVQLHKVKATFDIWITHLVDLYKIN